MLLKVGLTVIVATDLTAVVVTRTMRLQREKSETQLCNQDYVHMTPDKYENGVKCDSSQSIASVQSIPAQPENNKNVTVTTLLRNSNELSNNEDRKILHRNVSDV